MLLALDAGNTNITVGIFKNGELADHRRLRTVREQTSDEWGILLIEPAALRRRSIRRRSTASLFLPWCRR